MIATQTIPFGGTEAECTRAVVEPPLSGAGWDLLSIESLVWNEETGKCDVRFTVAADAQFWSAYFLAACADVENDCSRSQDLCVIDKIEAVAEKRAGSVTYDSGALPGILPTFPPQSSGARAALYKLARRKTLEAINQAGIATKDAIANLSSPCRTEADLKVLSTTFVELYHLYDDLTDLAVDAEVAVADAQRSTAASLREGVQRSVEGLELSRLSAARMLVDGRNDDQRPEVAAPESFDPVPFPSPVHPIYVPEVHASEEAGFCSTPQLRPSARKALSILRQVALEPAVLLLQPGRGDPTNDISIDDLIAAPTSLIPSGSVRTRLGVQPGYPQFNDALCTPPGDPSCITSATAVAEALGVGLEDFAEARAHMARELVAFSRFWPQDWSAVLNPTSTCAVPPAPLSPQCGGACVAGTCPTAAPYLLYAGTSSPPGERDPSYWSALALTPTDNAAGQSYDFTKERELIPNAAVPLPLDLLHFVHAVKRSAGVLMQAVSGSLGGFPELGEAVSGPLELLVEDISSRGGAHIRHCNGLSIEVHGLTPAAKLRVVVDEPGLQCAVQGNVDGAPCDDAFESGAFPLTLTKLTDALGSEGSAGSYTAHPLAPLRLYLVQPVGDSEAPGQFRALVGWPSEAWDGAPEPLGTNKCVQIPIVPDAIERAAAILKPNPSWCTHQAAECDGSEFASKMDQRLPLENELSDDGDAVESSWRTYLALARQASNEADLLGTEYVNGALDVELRAESLQKEKRQLVSNELEGLQQVCGTSVDVRPLLERLGAEGLDWSGSASGADLLTALRDVAGTSPEYQRLRDCLGLGEDGEADLVPYVTLGDQKLCVDSAPIACGSATSCLYPVSASIDCLSGKVAEPLDYFPFNDPPQPPTDGSLARLCRNIRAVRDAETGWEGRLASIQGTTFFNTANMVEFSKRVGWEARIGGYSAVTLDGAPIFSTGTWSGGPPTGSPEPPWPCGPFESPVHAEPCSEQSSLGSSLFCGVMPTICTDATMRARINYRLYRAVATLAALSGRGLSGLWLPAIFQNTNPEAASSRRVEHKPGSPDIRYHVTEFAAETSEAVPRTIIYTSASPPSSIGPVWYQWNGTSATEVELASGELDTFGLIELTDEVVDARREGGARENSDPFASLSRLPSRPEVATNGYGELAYRFLKGPYVPGEYVEERVYLGEISASAVPYLQALLVPEESGSTLGAPNAGLSYTREAVVDALELACELAAEQSEPTCDSSRPPAITADNLHKARDYIECLGGGVLRAGATTILQRVPVEAMDALRESAVEGSFPTLSGDLGARVSELRAQLVELSRTSGAVATEMGLLADDVDAFRNAVARAKNNEETAKRVADLQDEIAMAGAEAACVGAVAGAVSNTVVSTIQGGPIGGVLTGLSSGTSAALTCGYAYNQAELQGELAGAQAAGQVADARLSVDGALIAFKSAVRTRGQTLSDLRTGLFGARELADAKLAEIEGLRNRARRTLYRAAFFASDQADNQATISAVMANRRDGIKTRYTRALHNAKAMSFVAKRAIEQRIGMHLSEFRSELSLVDAPASWESTICSLDGIDFAKLSEEDGAKSFSDGFVGDYVTRLENFMESYRMAYGFQQGQDTAVISIRDDLHNVRAVCPVETGNLLRHSGDLTKVGADPLGWHLDGCALDSEDRPILPCVSAAPVVDNNQPKPDAQPGFGRARGYEVRFGTAGVDVCNDPTGTAAGVHPCGYRSRSVVQAETSALAQAVDLGVGRYLLSWHEDAPAHTTTLQVRFADGTVVQPEFSEVDDDAAGLSNGWRRFWFPFDVPSPQRVTIRIAQLTTEASCFVGGFMLQDISGVPQADVTAGDIAPHPYIETTDTTTRDLPECEDTSGTTFRAKNWERKCVWLCSDGYGTNCGPGGGAQACYRETSFDISQWAIEKNDILNGSGFARGNFNYRVESVGLNFVGSSTRDCGASDTPSVCYGGGFVPYSLTHSGPYYVRNHTGGDFEAKLFTGEIEHARGLAAERYLSNPLSSSDSALIEQYLRNEFRGRPLDGQYTLKVWEENGVDFDAIQDVQLVLKYRYWTRNN